MLHRFLLLVLGLCLLLATAAFRNVDQATGVKGGAVYAQLVVTISGPPGLSSSYGWIWDSGERRNGTPWIVTSGTLGGKSDTHANKSPNERIYWWITDQAWPNRVAPTEIEIMNAVGSQGWKLIHCFDSAQHTYVPEDFSYTTARTYIFMRSA
jgi:hypothetical protein